MINSTSTDVTYGDAECNRMIAKQDSCHSTAQAEKQISEERPHSTIPLHK